jgi:hypothetical protein
MQVERHVISLTTDSGGAATGYSGTVSGRVLGIVYVKTDFANGVDFTITAEATGEAILTLTDQNTAAAFYPRSQVHGPTGTALTLDGTRTANEPIYVANDRVKVVVAQGGNAKSGTVHVLVG